MPASAIFLAVASPIPEAPPWGEGNRQGSPMVAGAGTVAQRRRVRRTVMSTALPSSPGAAVSGATFFTAAELPMLLPKLKNSVRSAPKCRAAARSALNVLQTLGDEFQVSVATFRTHVTSEVKRQNYGTKFTAQRACERLSML